MLQEEKTEYRIESCPFCGKPAKLTTLFYDNTRHAVQCTSCNVRTDFYETQRQAIVAWNKRVKKAVE